MTTASKTFSVGKITRIAILTAMAVVLSLIPGIPIVGFYKLDLSLLPALLGTFSLGTLPGVIILGLNNLISLVHSGTMGIGRLADFIVGCAMLIPAGLIYHKDKTRKNALIGMAIGTLCMIVIGVLANKFILIPFYMTAFHMDMPKILGMCGVDSEWKLLLTVTAPFNLLKGVVLCVVTALIYKPLSPILHEKIR